MIGSNFRNLLGTTALAVVPLLTGTMAAAQTAGSSSSI